MFSEAILSNFYKAAEVTGIGMLGIFAFMVIFYLSIVVIDKLFPAKIEKK